jgi:glutathione S-transferase
VTILRETLTCSVSAAPRKDEAQRAMLCYGDFGSTMNVVANTVEQGQWLMGEQFTSADVVIGSNFRWSMMFKLIPKRKEFLDYADRRAGGAARGGQGQGVRCGGLMARRVKSALRPEC